MFFNHHGVLGINARNLLYIKPYNPKKAIRLADNKIQTKQYLSARGIPVPKLYGVIKTPEDLEKFDFNILPCPFVLKPNTGFGGEGIIPVLSKKDGFYMASGNQAITLEQFKDHIRDILDGGFSISNIADSAFFEQYIEALDSVGKYSYEGLPDIRIVVHNLIPVMAMLRLPTRQSQGKANLHMGAVGVGIDIANGKTTNISHKNKIIEELPDNLGKIRGLKIPYWDEILLIASKVQLITNLGYMAVDICLDRNMGPVLLEINARAGLGVQIANLAPLRKRLQRIEGIKVTTPVKGLRIAKDIFGNVVEKEIKQLSGKQVIKIKEPIEIITNDGIIRLMAKVDTGRSISVLNEEIANKYNLTGNSQDYDDEKLTLKIKFILKQTRIQTIVYLEKIQSKDYQIILGTRDLSNFLVDTSIEKDPVIKSHARKKEMSENPQPAKVNFLEIDEQLNEIDAKIKLLYHLKPLNLETEKKKFFENHNYNPQFEYPNLKFDPVELVEQLNKITLDDSVLGEIYQEKKQEIHLKIQLLEAIGEENFSDFSRKLFGQPQENDRKNVENLLSKIDFDEKQIEQQYPAEKAKIEFEKTFEHYGLKKWEVLLKENMVSDCVAGKNNRLFLKQDSLFSKERIKSLIVHEIETHILTAENGKLQPYEIFNRGLANYLVTQEGLAIYNVEKIRSQPFKKNYNALKHVICIYHALRHSFSECFKILIAFGISKDQAFKACIKAKRGFYDTGSPGAFTKDFIYFKGYQQIKNFIDNGGDIKKLYIGKFNLEDLQKIANIPGLSEPKHLPDWL